MAHPPPKACPSPPPRAQVEEEIRKQREASRGRLEERRRKKEQAIQNKLASVTKADLEDNEKMLEKLEASAGPSATQTRMMALKKLLPKLRLPGDLNQSKQRLEEQYQQKQEMLQKQQQEEARRQEKKLEEETRAEAMRQEGKVKAEQAARLDALRKEQEEKVACALRLWEWEGVWCAEGSRWMWVLLAMLRSCVGRGRGCQSRGFCKCA